MLLSSINITEGKLSKFEVEITQTNVQKVTKKQ
jgi:hypothetical protein